MLSLLSCNYLCWSLVLSSKITIFLHFKLSWYIQSYSNLISSICCRLSGGIYISLGITVGFTDVSSIWMAVDFLWSSRVLFEASLVVFSVILFTTRSPVTSAFFFFDYHLSEAVLRELVADNLWCQYLLLISLQRRKIHLPLK